MTDSELVDWADVAAVGVIARNAFRGTKCAYLMEELAHGRTNDRWYDAVKQTAAGIRYGAREVEREREQEGQLLDTFLAVAPTLLAAARERDTLQERMRKLRIAASVVCGSSCPRRWTIGLAKALEADRLAAAQDPPETPGPHGSGG